MSSSDTGPVRDFRHELNQKALQEELKGVAEIVGAVPLVDLLIERAFQVRVTDIHLDPYEDGVRVRIRVDGIMHDVLHANPALAMHVVSRIKVMAGMDLMEKRLCQDGHISFRFDESQRDIRVGSSPTRFGERLVLRLMPDGRLLTRLNELGLRADQIEVLQRCIRKPYGVVLSVGPVGSGKTTTIYSCLEELNNPQRSVVSIEDPVERRIPGVVQIQVEPKIDFHYANALRGLLRQDPNVLMIGEIRDPETAQIAMRAGRAGVMVLSTMHANDSAVVVDLLRDFNVPPMFVADSLTAVVSQRLLRRVCDRCKTSYTPDESTLAALGVSPENWRGTKLVMAPGCDHCFRTGFFGRIAVFEVLVVTPEIRGAILSGARRSEVLGLARDNGMRTLGQCALDLVLAGVTTVEEMHRLLVIDD